MIADPHSLRVAELRDINTGIQIRVQGRQDLIKIAKHEQILIRHKFARRKLVSTKELLIGDEILAYGFDITAR